MSQRERTHNWLQVESNSSGTDYVVGDLHGQYDLLMQELRRIGFDKTVDRLFCVGDLIDRGPDSYRCLLLLAEPWFYAVLGNHEDMMLQALRGPDVAMYLHWRDKCGGGWVLDIEAEALADVMERHMLTMPLAMEVGYQGRLVGLIRAAVTSGRWGVFDPDADVWNRRIAAHRCEADSKVPSEAWVSDIDAVVVGHNVTEMPCVRGNTVMLDTGAALGLVPTVWSLKTILEVVDHHAATGMPQTFYSVLTETPVGHSLNALFSR